MSFREKIAWISLLATGAIWGSYAFRVYGLFGGSGTLTDAPWLATLTARTIMMMVIVQAALTGIVAARAPAEVGIRDEREAMFDSRANRNGFFMLNAAVFGVALLPLALPFARAALAMGAGILIAMALAEMARAATLILAFRRGA
ncbi:MAG: hypothetical protein ACRCUI_09615 [Polymorphobacter sp.]